MEVLTSNIQCLIKFGRSEHMKDLYEKGKLYCNHIDTFKDYGKCNETKNSKIADVNEGVNKNIRIDGWKIGVKDNHIDSYEWLVVKHGTLKERVNYNACIYCMYYAEGDVENKIITVNGQIFNEFKEYDAYVVIFDVDTFIQRIKSLDPDFIHAKITYYNPLHTHENLTLFHKSINYKDQNEYRFVFHAINKMPRVLMLGCLEDIAEFGLIENINKAI